MWRGLCLPWSAIPVGRSQGALLPLSRREFLGFIASTPAAAYVPDALAAETSDADLELSFELSDDGRTLTVVRVHPDSYEAVPHFLPLVMTRNMFGEASWFDLEQPVARKKHVLHVRSVSYGDLARRNLQLIFENAGGWTLCIRTDIWLDSNGKTLEYDTLNAPIALDAFIAGKADAAEVLYASRVSRTLQPMLDGRIDAGPGKNGVKVALNSQFQWQLGSTSKPLTAFNGQIAVPNFELGWRNDAQRPNGMPQSPYLLGEGRTASLAALRLGADSGLVFRSLPAGPMPEGGWQLQIRRGASALRPDAFQTVSRLVIGDITAEFAKGGNRVAGPLGFSQAVATETRVLPLENQAETIRTVIVASGAVDAPAEKRGGDAAPSVPRSAEIATAIGRIRAMGAFENPKQPSGDAAEQGGTARPLPVIAEPDPGAEFGKIALAASGDRAGAPGQTTWIVADRGVKGPSPQVVRRAQVDLFLQEADTALPDVSHSRLLFQRTELRLDFADGRPLEGLLAEAPTPPSSSFIRLGGAGGGDGPTAVLDLSRAALTATRDYDQMRLRFRFSDMVLLFSPAPMLRPARDDCGVTAVPRPEPVSLDAGTARAAGSELRVDTRPVLVVEFDPQHVMEEAIFLPDPPPLPDVKLKAEQIKELRKFKDEAARREKINEFKIGNEKEASEGTGLPEQELPFAKFSNLFKDSLETAGLPTIQKIYIGPPGLSPDAFEIARNLQKNKLSDKIKDAVDRLIKEQAAAQIVGIQNGAVLPTDMGLRLELERKLESVLPFYGLFRSFYRDFHTGALDLRPADFPAGDAEYFHPSNRTGEAEPLKLEKRDTEAREKFSAFAAGSDAIKDIVEARLSGRSRLAFRVNCRPGPGDGHDANGLPAFPSSSALGAADVTFGAMPFTFAALTDWSHHEPAVTRRAEKLFSAAPSGVVPPLGEQAADLDDRKMLTHQGIVAGPAVTGAQRMSEVRASLAQMPTELETAIEIPSRLILSTAQDAVWKTSRRFRAPYGGAPYIDPPPLLEDGSAPMGTIGTVSSHSRSLWTANLLVDDVLPGLRVVGTPDYRPMALLPAPGNGTPLMPGHFAPPRGAYAPWLLGAEQSNSQPISPRETYGKLPSEDDVNTWKDDQEFCEAKPKKPSRSLRLVDWLCARFKDRASTDSDIRFFRTSLDAYDRHELLLLSSAYGLPVVGKRQALGDDVEKGGALIAGSGQFEPGDAFMLLDGRDGEAIYRPVPLSVTELTLSALGGSFTHDTQFSPPATALDVFGRPFFSGMSIERWQHQIVLGRDIRTEVVYKGYLFPLGHRASLVKLTERIFLLTAKQGYKALLRQHMFLRIGKPDKKYPAIGQPNSGRQWCAGLVVMLTRRTPDIVDPTTPVAKSASAGPGLLPEDPNGKLDLGASPGLAFWPKVNLTDEGRIAFQFTLDGKATSMPLLFLDNVAATFPESAAKVAMHYNSLLSDEQMQLRTMVLRGQKLKFAEEAESGDATYATEKVLVAAQGRPRLGGVVQWGGDNSLFETTPVLEGAEQPPFYPAMDKAAIRIEQVERFTGSASKSSEVRFDGFFLDSGFFSDKRRAGQTAGEEKDDNPLEVFLNLIDAVPLDMGSSGDRAAGLARPNSEIVALARKKGPLGADKDVEYKDKAGGKKDPHTGIASLASYFAKAVLPGESQKDEEQQNAAENGPPAAADLAAKLAVFQNFFSQDAKLLGLIKLRDLMKLFDLTGAELPLLKETVQFGASLQGKADDARALVRTNVLLPLKSAVASVRVQWDALDARLEAEQEKLGKADAKVSIKKLFPEIEQGLAGLEVAVDAALDESDLVKLAERLSRVYEAGKRLARLLASLAANATERVQAAARTVILGSFSKLIGASDKLSAALEKLAGIGNLDGGAVVQAAAKALIDAAAAIDEILPLPVPLPDLVAGVKLAGNATGELANAVALAEKLEIALREAAADKTQLASDLALTLESLGKGETSPQEATKLLAEKILAFAEAPLDAVVEEINQSGLPDSLKARLLDGVNAYRRSLNAAKKGLSQSEPVLPPQTAAALDTLKRQAETAKAFAAAVKAGNLRSVLQASAVLARQLFGFELDATALGFGLEKLLQEPAAFAADAVGALAKPLGFVQGDAVAWPSDAEAQAADKAVPPVVVPPKPPGSRILAVVAEALQVVVDAKTAMEAAEKAFSDHKDDITDAALQAQVGALLADTKQLRNAIEGGLSDAYRHVVRLGRSLQAVQASLAEAAQRPLGALKPATLLMRLSAERAAVEDALDGVSEGLGEVLKAIAVYLAKPGNEALLAGALVALALRPDLQQASAQIHGAVVALRLKVEALEKPLAAALFQVAGDLLSLLSQGAVLPHGGLAALIDKIDKLPAALNPERGNLAKALRDLDEDLLKNADLGFGKGEDPQTIRAVLALPVRPGGPSFEMFFEKLITGGASDAFGTLRNHLRNLENTAVASFRSLLARIEAVPDALLDRVFVAIAGAATPLADAYAGLLVFRNELLNDQNIPNLVAEQVRAALLVPSDPPGQCPVLGAGCDRLVQEVEWLKAVVTAKTFKDPVARDRMRRFLDGWQGGGAAPLVIAAQLENLVVRATSGDILSMIDVAALRDEIEDALAGLVPLRTTLAYDVNLATGEKGETDSKDSPFSLLKGSRFDIGVRLDIDLLAPENPARFRAEGQIGAFNVNLLGKKIFDALTLKFNGASFLIENGGKPSFDVNYSGFEIGDQLKFVQQLQSFLKPSGSGFYLQPMDGIPGIEAGYGINLGTIQLGGISFSNVSLNVATLLPFTDSEAMFRASLARKLAPFTITSPPFGGAGYFAITANAQKIVGFEASFEFGGSADFSFGPLVAFGRIMSGFFIRTISLPSGRVTELSGTFFAGGAASIWIFTFYASLYVKLGMTGEGDMEGEAIFTFAFSLGIVDYDYSVRVNNSQPAMGGGQQSAALPSPTRFAGLKADGIDPITTAGVPPPVTPEEYSFITGVKVATFCQGEDPAKYFDYFDLELLEDAA